MNEENKNEQNKNKDKQKFHRKKCRGKAFRCHKAHKRDHGCNDRLIPCTGLDCSLCPAGK